MFTERKAAQMAAYFLQKAGGRMSYMKLLKLMYLADRQSYAECGEPITGDVVYAMDNGPVLSKIYDFIKGKVSSSYWSELIFRCGRYDVMVRRELLTEEIAQLAKIIDKLDNVFRQFGHVDLWVLIDYTHTLKEWKEPLQGSRILISPDAIRAASQEKPPRTPQDIIDDIQTYFAAKDTGELDKTLSGLLKDGMKECYGYEY